MHACTHARTRTRTHTQTNTHIYVYTQTYHSRLLYHYSYTVQIEAVIILMAFMGLKAAITSGVMCAVSSTSGSAAHFITCRTVLD